MGLLDTLDNIVHGGVEKPASYERKKNYTFGEQLGNWGIGFMIHSRSHKWNSLFDRVWIIRVCKESHQN